MAWICCTLVAIAGPAHDVAGTGEEGGPAPIGKRSIPVMIGGWRCSIDLEAAADADDSAIAPGPGPDDDRALGPPPPRGPVVHRDSFDAQIFGDDTPVARAEYLSGWLDRAIDAHDRAYRLTDAQRTKLRLAGRGDLDRFDDRVEAARRDFEAIRDDLPAVLRLFAALDTLQIEYTFGPFGPRSLLAATLRGIGPEPRSPRPR